MLRTWLGIRRLDEVMKSEFSALLDQYCEGTRLWLRDELFEALPKDKRVLWLGGDAGVGKSVLAAFLAVELNGRNQLGSYFFCKANDSERNARKLVLYLAFGFALWQPVVGQQLLYIKTLEDKERRRLEEQQKQRSLLHFDGEQGGSRFTSVLD